MLPEIHFWASTLSVRRKTVCSYLKLSAYNSLISALFWTNGVGAAFKRIDAFRTICRSSPWVGLEKKIARVIPGRFYFPN